MHGDSPTRRRARRIRPTTDDRALPAARSTTRQLVQGRQLVCRAYRRDDGRWDVEGRLADIKTRDVSLAGSVQVAAGEPYRALSLAVTVDDALVVLDARVGADTKTEGTAAEVRLASACATLRGRCIDARSGAATAERFARAAECSHLAELLAAVIATAREAIAGPRAARTDADD
jgi:hypothetical protein